VDGFSGVLFSKANKVKITNINKLITAPAPKNNK
jgi:hypothetical protein